MLKLAVLVAVCVMGCFARSSIRMDKAPCIDLSKMTASLSAAGMNRGMHASIRKNVKMNFAIVDAGANLRAFLRMDGAWLGSKDIAIKKAKTATFFNMSTGAIGKLSQPGGDLYNIEHSNGGLISFPGGIPVHNCKGELIGAVGVSGSTVADDHAVAEEMVAAMQKWGTETEDRDEYPPLDMSKMNQWLALEGVMRGFEASHYMNVTMDLAVVDVDANLQMFLRMDDAWLGSVDIAIKKAKTSTFFNMPTGDIGKLSQPGGDLYNIEHSNGGLITFPGGFPVRNCKKELIGAVGVSGSTVENDHAVARQMVLTAMQQLWFYC